MFTAVEDNLWAKSLPEMAISVFQPLVRAGAPVWPDSAAQNGAARGSARGGRANSSVNIFDVRGSHLGPGRLPAEPEELS